MGVSCGQLDHSFHSLYKEAKEYYKGHKTFFFDYLTVNGIDQQLEKIQKQQDKYSKLKPKSWKKQLKIMKVTSYLEAKTNELINARRRRAIRDEKNNAILSNLFNFSNLYLPKFESYILQLCTSLNVLLENKDYYIPPENYGYLSFQPKNYIINEEWINAYHGTGRNCKNDKEIIDMIQSIYKNGFRNGKNNFHSECPDINHPGYKVGIGVYVTPIFEIAKNYAGEIEIQGERYSTIFLVKVKQNCIRRCNCPNALNYWVVNGSPDEIVAEKLLYEKK